MNGPGPSSDSRAKSDLELRLFLFLFLIVCVVFHPALNGEFLNWDDDINISHNPHLNGLGWSQLRWMFTDLTYMRRYQPLCWLVWSAIQQCFGLRPFYFHAILVLFHAANAGLAFLLIRKLLLLAQPSSVNTAPATVCAAFAAALWAVHPLRVETTAWAVELVFVQPLFFLLLSLLCYLRAGAQGAARPGYWAALAFFVLSLFSYPLALGGFVIFIALDVFPLRRLTLNPADWFSAPARRVWLEKIPFAAVTLFCGWINLLSRARAIGFPSSPTLAQFGPAPRIMQAFFIWAWHAWKPWLPFGLTPERTELVDFQPFAPPFVLSAVFVLGLTVLLFWQRRRWTASFLTWLCYLALLVPALGLTEHPHFPADRYSLIPNLCWAVLLAGLFLKLWPNARIRRPLFLTVAIVAGLLGAMSYRQTFIWTSNVSLFREILARMPDRPQLDGRRFDVSLRLAQACRDAGDFSAATDTLDSIIQKWPEAAAPREQLGYTLTLAGQLDAARATYEAAAQTNLEITPSGWNDLGVAFAQTNRLDDAVSMFNEALRRAPHDPATLENLVHAYTLLGNTNQAALFRRQLDAVNKKTGIR
jgi:protein O-mannosyl-transferase